MSESVTFEELEDQDRLSNNCAECSIKLTDENRSGWFRLTEHDIQIELCNSCAEDQKNAPPIPKSN